MIGDPEFEKVLSDISIPTTPELDERILADAFVVLKGGTATDSAAASLKRIRTGGTSIHRFPRCVTTHRGRLRVVTQSIQFVLDYPEHGPTDIFALGVPLTAEVVDRGPHNDLNRLLEGVKTSLERFENYRGYVVKSGIAESQSWPCQFTHYPEVWRIYRKGMRWRLEAGLLRPHAKPPELPQPGADLQDWVHTYASRVEFVPISLCDGKTVYRARLTKKKTHELQTLDHWELKGRIRPELGISEGEFDQASWYRPEFLAYPSIPVGQLFETNLNTNPTEGPSGTVLVTSTATRGYDAGYTARYWIAACRSFVVMRWEWEHPGKKPRPYIIEEFDKSPNGIWYPTAVRWKTGRLDSDGKTRISDQVTLFFLDFDADLPNSLFVRE